MHTITHILDTTYTSKKYNDISSYAAPLMIAGLILDTEHELRCYVW